MSVPITDNQRRREVAAAVLDDWATAIRGDWGSIDGRTCRDELGEISAFLLGERDTLTPKDVGVCTEGKYGAHWEYHFDNMCDQK